MSNGASIAKLVVVAVLAALYFGRRRRASRRNRDGDEDVAEAWPSGTRDIASAWEIMKARPGAPLSALAEEFEEPPIVLENAAVRQAFARGEGLLLARDLVAREIRERLPRGWGREPDAKPSVFGAPIKLSLEYLQRQSFFVRPHREPYSRLNRAAREALVRDPPTADWLPVGPDDPRLRAAFDAALASLPELDQALVARGESLSDPGDLCAAATSRCQLEIYDDPAAYLESFARHPREIAILEAARLCASEANNGGVPQLLHNSTGVLVPEAVEGFLAIGMPKAAKALQTVMTALGEPYPRDRRERERAVESSSADAAAAMSAADDSLLRSLWREAHGFDWAADSYAARCIFKSAWEDLVAHPGLSIVAVAEKLGLSTTQLERLAVEQALARRQASAVTRDLVIRALRYELPASWDAATDAQRSRVFVRAAFQREPYRSLLRGMREWLARTPPPDGWMPTSGDDAVLACAYDGALASLPATDQELVARGEVRVEPGDRYKEVLRSDLHHNWPMNYGRLPEKFVFVLAAHTCKTSVESEGVARMLLRGDVTDFLPPAVAGFTALGMARTASVLERASLLLGDPVPKEQVDRARALASLANRNEVLAELTKEFLSLVGDEAGGFESAADAYVDGADFPAADALRG